MKIHAKRTATRPARHAPKAAPAGVLLGRVLGREGDACRVRAGGVERVLRCDPTVDPALLEEGARVVIDDDLVVGLLVTARAVTIGRDGAVDAAVKGFRVTAEEDITLRSPGAFVRVRGVDLELYGNRVLTRARELVKVLGRMVKIN